MARYVVLRPELVNIILEKRRKIVKIITQNGLSNIFLLELTASGCIINWIFHYADIQELTTACLRQE